MIRINLLPEKQVKKVQAGQRQLMIFAMAVIAEVAVFFFLYQLQAGVVEEKQRKITNLETEIAQLKKEVGDFDQLKQRHVQLLAQQKVIDDLQRGRTGPVKMMRELSNILTNKGPTVNQAEYERRIREDPNYAWNPRWNPHRLWLDELVEKGGLLRVKGRAKDYDDVAEFNRRIAISERFSDDFLERNDQIQDNVLQQKLVRFSLRCRVKY